MKKNEQVSTPVIKRLPRYHRYLEELKRQGVVRISSKELSARMGLTASQIRQDLNCFGGFGQQGYGYNIELLEEVVNKLADSIVLEPKYKDHELSGDFKGLRECHITPDWLLIYQVIENELVLYLSRTGNHSDLF